MSALGMGKFCNCEVITGVARDGKSTCIKCGGIDAYKKSKIRESIALLESLPPESRPEHDFFKPSELRKIDRIRAEIEGALIQHLSSRATTIMNESDPSHVLFIRLIEKVDRIAKGDE